MILLITTTIIVIGFLIKASIRPKNFPPGPRGLPFIGYLPFLPRTPMPIFSAMPELSRRYGSVVGFFLGPCQPVVAVCSREVAKEALLNPDLDGRPEHFAITNLTFGEKLGLFLGDGEIYFEQRNFVIRHLSTYNSKYEDRISTAVDEIMQAMETQLKLNPECIINFESIFFGPIVNILWEILAGRKVTSEDVEFQKILANLKKFNQTLDQHRLLTPFPKKLYTIFPALRKICGYQSDLLFPLQEFIQIEISRRDEARKSPDFRSNCLIDSYLEEIDRRSSTKNEKKSFTEAQLVAILQDLFISCCLPVSYTIGFALLRLVAYPEVQQKVQNELDEVCNYSRPSLLHRSRLPYTDGVLIECQRLSSVAPTTLPHRALVDTQIKGYHIPKDSFVFVQLKDPFADSNSLWSDPETFCPERHLTIDEGKYTLNTNDLMIPYSFGNRACLGKTLANNTYFMAVCRILKAYALKSASNDKPRLLDPVGNLVSEYQGFELLAISRTLRF